jgi:hypothetical protein
VKCIKRKKAVQWEQERVHLFVAFDIIQNNVWLHINTREDYKMYLGKKVEWMVVLQK